MQYNSTSNKQTNQSPCTQYSIECYFIALKCISCNFTVIRTTSFRWIIFGHNNLQFHSNYNFEIAKNKTSSTHDVCQKSRLTINTSPKLYYHWLEHVFITTKILSKFKFKSLYAIIFYHCFNLCFVVRLLRLLSNVNWSRWKCSCVIMLCTYKRFCRFASLHYIYRNISHRNWYQKICFCI